MSFYDHKEIEPKWQKYWADHHTFKTGTDASKPKFYALDMFPYPSGAGLHVGHPDSHTTGTVKSIQQIQTTTSGRNGFSRSCTKKVWPTKQKCQSTGLRN